MTNDKANASPYIRIVTVLHEIKVAVRRQTALHVLVIGNNSNSAARWICERQSFSVVIYRNFYDKFVFKRIFFFWNLYVLFSFSALDVTVTFGPKGMN
jgi:hypothetical protein